MVNEGKEHEQEDKKARDAVEKRNRLDGMILELEKTIAENKEKLDPADVQTTQDAIEKAKQALKDNANDAEKLQAATDELMQSSHKIAETLYKQAQAQQTDAAQNADQDTAQQQQDTTQQQDEPKQDEPIDAEINQ